MEKQSLKSCLKQFSVFANHTFDACGCIIVSTGQDRPLSSVMLYQYLKGYFKMKSYIIGELYLKILLP